MSYYFSKTVDLPFEEALTIVTEELKKEGFGILTEIDVKATLKKKLDVDFRKYKILGACNPPFAYEALKAERNVIVQDADGGQTEIAAVDPIASMQAIENPALRDIAEKIQAKLQHVIESL